MSTSHEGDNGSSSELRERATAAAAPEVRADPADPTSSADSADPADPADPGRRSAAAPPGEPVYLPDFVAALPEQVWYLTASGQEMWCRRPYGFFFSTSEAAVAFAATLGSAFELSPIGVNSKEIISGEAVAALRQLGVHRLFIDPGIDPQSGDVFGRILRLEPAGPLQ